MTIGRKVISASTLERPGDLWETSQRDSNNEFEAGLGHDLNPSVLSFRRHYTNKHRIFDQESYVTLGYGSC